MQRKYPDGAGEAGPCSRGRGGKDAVMVIGRHLPAQVDSRPAATRMQAAQLVRRRARSADCLAVNAVGIRRARPRTGVAPTNPPDDVIGASGFDFTRFGVRVPAVLVSPLIPAGTILHAPTDGQPPFDHTSIIATLRARFGIGALGQRDAAASNVGPALTLPAPRTDDPLAAIQPPTAADPVLQAGSPPVGAAPSSFLEAKALAAAALPVPTDPIADPQATVKKLRTAADQYTFIQQRRAAWRAAGRPLK